MKIETAVYEFSAGVADQLKPSTLPEIAFSGRSNVGKSSLLNKLLQRKSLARVSATPGKTATINFYRVDTMRLVDLPGYGYARVSDAERHRWADLIEGYFNDQRDLRLVLQLVDMRHPPSKDDY
ncbi:MAG TPA: ribosome biogenesis GTP-binding protein YihA/YsxC, partial [Firmicutes bacterium]|nr:ribosome biogenesis GTP-binding protein YihA/YsxC [Bacillota bacterium]